MKESVRVENVVRDGIKYTFPIITSGILSSPGSLVAMLLEHRV